MQHIKSRILVGVCVAELLLSFQGSHAQEKGLPSSREESVRGMLDALEQEGKKAIVPDRQKYRQVIEFRGDTYQQKQEKPKIETAPVRENYLKKTYYFTESETSLNKVEEFKNEYEDLFNNYQILKKDNELLRNKIKQKNEIYKNKYNLAAEKAGLLRDEIERQSEEYIKILKEKDTDIASKEKEIKLLKGELASRVAGHAEKKENHDRKFSQINKKNISKKNLSQLYEELGAAYTQAKAYNSAIKAYKRALRYDSGNCQAHYGLGLLYEHSRRDSDKAIYHLKRYLVFKPEAQNKAKVDYLIKIIQNKK